jgi:hypothetical protein
MMLATVTHGHIRTPTQFITHTSRQPAQKHHKAYMVTMVIAVVGTEAAHALRSSVQPPQNKVTKQNTHNQTTAKN